MPKFVEYTSDDDDEIEVIPYVKPAPPVIDLVEDEIDELEKSKKKGKKSKKKKKSRDVSPNPEESTAIAPTSNSLPVDIVNGTVNSERENSQRAETSDRNVEQSPGVGSETSPGNLSSGNVVRQKRAAKTAPCLETNNPPSSQPMIPMPTSIAESGVIGEESGSKSVSTPEVEVNDTASSKPRRRAAPKRPRPLSQTSATKKTAAEISSFLNTLGIPIEVRDLTPKIPRKPRGSPKAKRKSLDMSSVPQDDSGTLPPPISTEESLVTVAAVDESIGVAGHINGFVQVTQEVSERRKRSSPSKKRKSSPKTAAKGRVIDDLPQKGDLITNFVLHDGQSWPTNAENLEQPENSPSEKTDEPRSRKRKRKDQSRDLSDNSSDNSQVVSEDMGIDTGRAKSPSHIEVVSEQSSLNAEVGVEQTLSKKRKKSSDIENEGKNKKNREKGAKRTVDDSSSNIDSIIRDVAMSGIRDESPCQSPTKKKSKSSKSGSQKEEESTSPPDLATGEPDNSRKRRDQPKDKNSRESRKADDENKNERTSKGDKSKEKEKTDKEMMPPPQPPKDISNSNQSPSSDTPRGSREYYRSHTGFPPIWTDDMKAYYGQFRGKDFTLRDVYKRQSNDRSLWKAPLDAFRRNRSSGVRCSICHQFGHVNRNCPDRHKPVTCSMCGGKGHTFDSTGINRCPKTCCLNCGLQRENFSSGCSSCIYRQRPIRCNLCGVSGHLKDSCPDNWRRYHSITTTLPDGAEDILKSVPSTQYKGKREMFCCNCASPGHNYYDCNAPRNKSSPYHRNKPYIVNEIDLEAITALKVQQAPPSTSSSNDRQTPSPNRTVVVNRNEREKEESEVISIRIQNDPLVGGASQQCPPRARDSPLETIGRCSEYPDCTNKVTKSQGCHHIAVNNYQQTLLQKARDAGAIRPVEELCKVHISILRAVLQVHIAGENWKKAENELYEILFTKAKEEQIARDNRNSSLSGETTRKVVNDGNNISVVISKPAYISKTFSPPLPPAVALPVVPSMDVDERFASPQDLITNIPIIRPDGPFAPGHYVPYSVLPELIATTGHPLCIPVPPLNFPLPNGLKPVDDQHLKSNPKSTEKLPTSTPAKNQGLAISDKKAQASSKRPIEATTISLDDSDDDIVILEEVKEPPPKVSKTLPKSTQKDEVLNVLLLPSEFSVVFADSLKKDGVLEKISRIFGVTIFVSNEDKSCTIKSGTLFSREKAKEKVTLWLGCHAAKTQFVLNEPEDPPAPTLQFAKEIEPESRPRKSHSGSPRKRSLGPGRSRGGLGRRGGSSPRRYNPAPNTHSAARPSSSGHRGSDTRGSSYRPPLRFQTRPFRGKKAQVDTRNASGKPETQSSKRFRYFH